LKGEKKKSSWHNRKKKRQWEKKREVKGSFVKPAATIIRFRQTAKHEQRGGACDYLWRGGEARKANSATQYQPRFYPQGGQNEKRSRKRKETRVAAPGETLKWTIRGDAFAQKSILKKKISMLPKKGLKAALVKVH